MKEKDSRSLVVPEVSEEVIEKLRSANAELRASGILSVTKLVLPAIPDAYEFKPREREFVENAVHSAFDLVGGLPRLVMWADNDYDSFIKVWSRLLPEPKKAEQAGTNINIFHGVPPSPIDEGVYEGDEISDITDIDDDDAVDDE